MRAIMFDFLMTIPAAVKVGGTFLAILAVNRLGLSLGTAILSFSFVLAFWSGMAGGDILTQLASFRKPENYLLPVVILLLLFFTEALDRTGRIAQTLAVMKSRLPNRKWLFLGLPAFVGLLPMPGGALFSAPLVAAADSENGLDNSLKAALNYWFRHIWEYWWPLYPGVILAVRYSGLPFGTFLALQFPFTVAALAGGYIFLLRRLPLPAVPPPVPPRRDPGPPPHFPEGSRERQGPHPPAPRSLGELFSAAAPIIVLIITSLAGSVLLPHRGLSGTTAGLLSMLAGLIIATAMAFAGRGAAWRETVRLLGRAHVWNMLLLVISIQVFAAVLQYPQEATGKTIVAVMRDEFIAGGIPVTLLIAGIPFISGLATGVAFGFVGASFPIIFALLGDNPGLPTAASATALAYACGYAGMMLSPLHICYVVTCEYFQIPLWRTYRHIAGPTALIVLFSLALATIYRHLL